MRSWSRVARWLPVDEQEDGFGWAIDEPLERTSHALRVDGRVWLIDPVDAPELEDRIRALGEPAGVLQLLDRHARDGAAWAARLGVPLVRAFEGPRRHAVPGAAGAGQPLLAGGRALGAAEPDARSAPTSSARSSSSAPETSASACTLCCDSRRRARSSRVAPERVLVGHGGGIHQDAAAAVHDTVRNARRRIPAALASAVRAVRSVRRSRN